MRTKTEFPWYSATRWKGGGWGVWIEGRMFFLGRHPAKAPAPKQGEDGRWNAPKEIAQEWAKLKFGPDSIARQDDYTLGQIVVLFLESLDSPKQVKQYSAVLEKVCQFQVGNKKLGSLLVNSQLRGEHLTKFLNHKDAEANPWTKATKETYGRYAKQALRWAAKNEDLKVTRNAFASVVLPQSEPRKALITPDMHAALKKRFDAAGKKNHGDKSLVLEFLWLTGARPGEAYKIEARHIHQGEADGKTVRYIRLEQHEHKTGEKTNAARIVGLRLELAKILDQQAAKYPEGKLFRNSQGRPFKTNTVAASFDTAKAEGLIPEDVVPYCYRHSFATACLKAKMSIYDVAKMLGHTNIQTLQKWYDKTGQDHPHIASLFIEAESKR